MFIFFSGFFCIGFIKKLPWNHAGRRSAMEKISEVLALPPHPPNSKLKWPSDGLHFLKTSEIFSGSFVLIFSTLSLGGGGFRSLNDLGNFVQDRKAFNIAQGRTIIDILKNYNARSFDIIACDL